MLLTKTNDHRYTQSQPPTNGHHQPNATRHETPDPGNPMTTRITQSQLESYLWGAAVRLRGYIDAGDYKQFIE